MRGTVYKDMWGNKITVKSRLEQVKIVVEIILRVSSAKYQFMGRHRSCRTYFLLMQYKRNEGGSSQRTKHDGS